MSPDEICEIYRDGRHYDRLFGVPDVPFWLEVAGKVGGPILELGCGTGKIAIPFAEAGHEVVGIDLAEGMLRQARAKVVDRDLPVCFRHADMTNFSLEKRFSLILIPSNSLCHLLTIDDVEACFRQVSDHLAEDGIFAIDVFVPNLQMLLQDPEEEQPFSEYDDPDGRGRVVVTTKSVYEPDTQIRRNRTFHQVAGVLERTGRLDMRMYFPQELEALLRYNGFRVVEKYGGYDRSAFSRSSGKQVVLARKR